MQAENKQTNTKHGEANLKQTTKHETWWSKFETNNQTRNMVKQIYRWRRH